MALWFLSGSLVTPTSGKILSAYPNEPSLQKREIPDISRDLIQQKFRLRADRQCYRNFFWAEQRKQKNFVEKVIRQKKIFEEECQVSNPSSSPVSLSTFLFAFWVGWTLSYFFFKFVYLHSHTHKLNHTQTHTHSPMHMHTPWITPTNPTNVSAKAFPNSKKIALSFWVEVGCGSSLVASLSFWLSEFEPCWLLKVIFIQKDEDNQKRGRLAHL